MEWIEKNLELIPFIILSGWVIIVIICKVLETSKKMAIAMKLPNISGRGMNKYPEHNQDDVEHGDK